MFVAFNSSRVLCHLGTYPDFLIESALHVRFFLFRLKAMDADYKNIFYVFATFCHEDLRLLNAAFSDLS